MNLPDPGMLTTAASIQQKRMPRQVSGIKKPGEGAVLGFLHRLKGLNRSQRPALFKGELPGAPKRTKLTMGPAPLSGMGTKTGAML